MNNRKRHVADVALTLFIEQGVQQTSIQEIIEQANISKGTFYNYFASKNECIAEILQALRYEASQKRLALEVGKDSSDKVVLIDQISVLLQMNEERNVHAFFEGLLHSNETELKKLVLQHRLYEIRWLQQRLIDVYGFVYEQRSYEASVLLHGMLQHMLFVLRITNSAYSLKGLITSLFSYIELIMPNMQALYINLAGMEILEGRMTRPNVSTDELLNMAREILAQHVTIEQRELIEAVVEELQRDTYRMAVLRALLPSIPQSFLQSSMEAQVQLFVNLAWYYVKAK